MRLTVPFREPPDEARDEEPDVLGAFTKRRQRDREDVQAVVQVRAKLAAPHHLEEILVGRRDHSHVHRQRPAAAAEPLDLLLLQRSQQLRLELERQVADLVQEQGAADRRSGTARRSAPRLR